MPAVDNGKGAAQPARQKASSKYESLTPLEAALVDQIGESNERVVQAVNKLAARAPHPVLVWTIGAAILVYVISVVAVKGGVDVGEAAGATKTVLEAAVIEDAPAPGLATAPAPPVEAPAAATVGAAVTEPEAAPSEPSAVED